MFSKLLIFEWRYHIRHISFIAFTIFFACLGFMLSKNSFGEPNLYRNSTYNITLTIGILSLVAIFCMMVFASRVLLRDRQYRMEELIFATPISKGIYLGSRFLGFFTAVVCVFSFAVIGLWLGALTSGAEAERMGPILWCHYVWPFLVLALPNLFLGAVLLFVIASLTKKAVATYTGGVILYCLYWVTAMFLNSPLMAASTPASPEGMALAAVLDPFGLSAFFEQNQYWEVAQRNSSLLALEGYFLQNRICWLLVSFLLLAGNYIAFTFRKGISKPKKNVPTPQVKQEERRLKRIPNSPINIEHYWQQILESFGLEFRQLIRSWPFLLLLIIWMAVVASEIASRIYGGGEYGTDRYPTTDLMIWLFGEGFSMYSILLIIFYSGEIIHRERLLKMQEIKDVLPIKNFVFYFSKYMTVLSIPLLLLSTAIGIAIVFQIAKGYFIFEPLQYLSTFYFHGLPIFLFAILALFIQTVTANKYIGMFICLVIVLIFTSSLSTSIGIYHPMLKFGSFPSVDYNNMNGFSSQSTFFHWAAIYWGSFCLLLGFTTFQLWRRGNLPKLKQRAQLLSTNWNKKSSIISILCLTTFVASGAFIYYNNNILHKYQSQEAILDQKADYEKKYKRFKELAEPDIVDLKTKLDLYPEQRKYRMAQDFILENKTDSVINKLWFTTNNFTKVQKFKIENASLTKYDSIHQVYWFQFKVPLLPGAQIKMEYDITDNNQGFRSRVALPELAVAKNGSNLMSQYIQPAFGYFSGNEIRNNVERKKRGLEPKEEGHSDHLHGTVEDKERAGYNKFTFESILSTSSNQTAIVSGNLINKWTENNRNYFHYKSDQPITNFYGYLSANYKIKQKNYKGVSLEVYYSDGHDYNIDLILETMEQTLDYCQEAFASYSFDHLRIAEIPGYWPMGGYATPGMIALVEDKAFFTDLRNPNSFDVVTKRVAHEIAHQWFGHQLTPENSDGAAMLVESLAKYIEVVMIDKKYGKGQLRALLTDQMRGYFSNRNRSTTPEPPLDKVDDQHYIAYEKGCIVLSALRDLLGEKNVNAAIKKLFQQYAYSKADNRSESVASSNPKGGADDFVRILKTISPEVTHTLIDDWVSKIVIYNLKVESVTHEKLSDGRFEITATIFGGKSELRSNSRLHELAFNEEITLGFFDVHPDELRKEDKAIFLERRFLKSGENKLVFVLDKLPKYIGVDPFLNLLDKNVVDNVKEVR